MTSFDRRPALHGAYDHAAGIVAGVRADQLGLPTPCPDFDVAGLIDHIVGAGHRAVAIGRGETPTGEGFPSVELLHAPQELRRAGKDAGEAWADDARLSATTTMPWGETYAGTTLVDMYLVELAAHSWDLAAATGQLGDLDDDLASVSLEAARSMLRPEYRNLVEEGSPYGPEVDPPADATPWERFAAFMGRRPR